MKKLLWILLLFASINAFSQTPKNDAGLATESTNEIKNKTLNQTRIDAFNQNHIASKLSLFGSTLIQNLPISGAGFSLSLGTSSSRLSTFTLEMTGASLYKSTGGALNFVSGADYGFFSDLRQFTIYGGSTTPNHSDTHRNVSFRVKGTSTNFGSGTEFAGLMWLPNTSTAGLTSISNTPPDGSFAYDIDFEAPTWYDGSSWRVAASLDDITAGSGSVNDSLRVKTETGTSYTPTQADHNYIIYLTAATTVTIELDNTLEPHTALHFRKDGAGDVIFVSDGTSVLTSRGSNTTDTLITEYATCTWIKRDATEFSGIGSFGEASSSGGGSVTDVTGTTNRITSTGGATPAIDISTNYAGQSSITNVGTLTSGATGVGFTIALSTSTVTGTLAGTSVSNTPAGSIAATTAQAAINELDTEKAALASPTFTGTPAAPTATAGTNTTQIATTAFVQSAKNVSHNVQTGNYTAALTDAHNTVIMRSVSGQNFTVPALGTVAFPEGTRITIVPDSTGVTTVVAAAGVNVESSSGNLLSAGKDSPMVLEKKNGNNLWYLWNGTGGSFESGTFTPTLTNTANVAASTAYLCTYVRIDNTVIFSGRVDIDPTTTTTSTQLGISIPIASAFTTANQAGGTAVSTVAVSDCAAVLSDATNDRLLLQYICSDVTNHAYYFTVTYQRIP